MGDCSTSIFQSSERACIEGTSAVVRREIAPPVLRRLRFTLAAALASPLSAHYYRNKIGTQSPLISICLHVPVFCFHNRHTGSMYSIISYKHVYEHTGMRG